MSAWALGHTPSRTVIDAANRGVHFRGSLMQCLGDTFHFDAPQHGFRRRHAAENLRTP